MSKKLVATRREDVPTHFIPLSEYGCNGLDRLATPDYRALHRAWTRGELRGYKIMKSADDKSGQVFIDPDEAKLILSPVRPRPAALDQEDDATHTKEAYASSPVRIAVSIDTINRIAKVESAFVRMTVACEGACKLLERIAESLELLATEPKATTQSSDGDA